MSSDASPDPVDEIKQFARRWNQLYAEQRFEEMKALATEDVAIANRCDAAATPAGLIFGRQAYYDGIVGASGPDHDPLVMDCEHWDYVPLGEHAFYTVGRFTLAGVQGMNCWLLRRTSAEAPWLIQRVINTDPAECPKPS